jgi:hypothetical protein
MSNEQLQIAIYETLMILGPLQTEEMRRHLETMLNRAVGRSELRYELHNMLHERVLTMERIGHGYLWAII